MAISDIFSPTFLFSSLIIVILVGGIFSYISYKMSEQDHKLSAMIGLVSHMNDELQYCRSKLTTFQDVPVEDPNVNDAHKMLFVSQLLGGNKHTNNLITVSDDEDDEDEDDDDEDEEDEDEDEDDDEDEDEDEEDDTIEDLEVNEDLEDDTTIEDLDKINLNEDDFNTESDDEKTNKLNIDDDCNSNSNALNIDLKQDIVQSAMLYQPDIKTIHLEEPIHLIHDETLNNEDENENENDNDVVIETDLDFLKSVSVNYLDNDIYKHKPDYKKMTINKLREIVVEKELICDASKLKKHDILKMLGDE